MEMHAWVLPVGVTLARRRIANAICPRYHKKNETPTHLLRYCPESRDSLTCISQNLPLRFPSERFDKSLWIFGRINDLLSSSSIFLHWIGYWAFGTIWMQHNQASLANSLTQPYVCFRASLRQSLYGGHINGSCMEIFFLCF